MSSSVSTLTRGESRQGLTAGVHGQGDVRQIPHHTKLWNETYFQLVVGGKDW